MLLNEFEPVTEKMMDPREAIIRRALEIIDQDMRADPRKVKPLERYAFDVWRAVGLKNMTPRDLVTLYRNWKGVTEGVGRITAQNKTADVGYDAISKEAAKFGNKVDRDGRPPLLREGKYPIEAWDNWEGDRQYREQGAKIVNMTPEEYLSRVRPLTMDPESEENIDLLVSHVKAGGRLDPLKIYANGKEDGRHRAYAAKKLGIKTVPVIVWPQLNESYTPYQIAIMEGGHLLEDDLDVSREELEEWLASGENEMEEVDDASRWAQEDGEDTSALERDYQALHAVEMVIRNHLIALRNPVLLDQSIFLYNIVTDAVQYAALHIVINGDVAELKWLGNLGRKGVGSKLLHNGLQLAKARGAKHVKLTTKWNSEGFYQKQGFKADGETQSNALSGSNNTPMSKTLESTQLNELFNRTYPWEWTMTGGSWMAQFEAADGVTVSVFFESDDRTGRHWETGFKKGISSRRTGTGDQYAIFATVIEIIQAFMNENPRVETLTFIAAREGDALNDPAIRDSREVLYKRMIQRYASKNNMKFSWQKQGYETWFAIERSKPQINEIESMELGKDWGEVSRWRWSGTNTARIFKIGRVGGLDVVVEKESRGYMNVYLVDRKKDNLTVGEIQLYQEGQAWATDTTILSQGYQGRGLMLQVYVLLCKQGLILRSGSQQSPGGKKIWLALSKQPGITVYAGYQDDNNEWTFSDIDNDDDDRIRAGINVYDQDETEADKEFQNEIFSIQRNMDKMSALFMKTKDTEEKIRYRTAYKNLEIMLKKVEAERAAAQQRKQDEWQWKNSYLFAVADGVELSNRF